ncbi:MAG TPA: hypothetical protein VE291_08405 [Terracidiphilus sp.]|nr:hypothetical protein [Terracidiphilus sp.]
MRSIVVKLSAVAFGAVLAMSASAAMAVPCSPFPSDGKAKLAAVPTSPFPSDGKAKLAAVPTSPFPSDGKA